MTKPNLKEMQFEVFEEDEAIAVMDLLSITQGVHGFQMYNNNNDIFVDILYNEDVLTEEKINALLSRYTSNPELLEEFYDMLFEEGKLLDEDGLKAWRYK